MEKLCHTHAFFFFDQSYDILWELKVIDNLLEKKCCQLQFFILAKAF